LNLVLSVISDLCVDRSLQKGGFKAKVPLFLGVAALKELGGLRGIECNNLLEKP
jgi:hypothetical protein